jgi:hypothetical protein
LDNFESKFFSRDVVCETNLDDIVFYEMQGEDMFTQRNSTYIVLETILITGLK